MKINRNEILTEKGKVKADVRKDLMSHIDKKRELFEKAVKVKDGIYQIPYENPNGDKVYVRFTIQVSEKSADELAPPKKKVA